MASAECKFMTRLWRQSLQIGPGTDPLVRRSGAKPEAEGILSFSSSNEA